ncbi:MAG TPA: hypothetical protein VJG90_03340 [Candidatus Nanoarchaeia archaeon]|nr:hypothetical protein [Candidatus Nanoarchaeia archaeon]
MLACKVRKWGNSLGLIIPRKVAEELRIKADEEIWADFQKKENPLKELFGALPFKKSGKELMREIRKDMESKYL